jgi:CMP-N,N'-diacetyllegionaminic acid synthase
MLALIPARGGSKGLPGKNIKEFCGKPLIVHTIETAQKSCFIDRIVVSTDDMYIAELARKHKAEVPFMRPSELATDDALAKDAYVYTIERLNKEFNGNYENFIVLCPTAPLRTSEDIDRAIDLFNCKKADSVVSVTQTAYPPTWMRRIDKEGILRVYSSQKGEGDNRQTEEIVYIPNGAIYVLTLSILKDRCSYYSEKTYPYIMPRERSIDIDDELDFEVAQFLYQK